MNEILCKTATRAEENYRRTKSPTCFVCRHMKAELNDMMACRRKQKFLVVEGCTFLGVATRWASSCDDFDSMVEL